MANEKATQRADIFDLASRLSLRERVAILIPTNGVVKENGWAVMGAGLARQAADRFRDFPSMLGMHLRENGNVPGFNFPIGSSQTGLPGYSVCSFPTKEHFAADAQLDLIERSAIAFREFAGDNYYDRVLVPKLGAGLGKLPWPEVKATLQRHFNTDAFVFLDDTLTNEKLNELMTWPLAQDQVQEPQQTIQPPKGTPKIQENLIVAITGDLVLKDGARQHLTRVLDHLRNADALVRVGTSSGTEAFVRDYAKANGGPRLEIHPTFDTYQHNGIGTVVPIENRDKFLTDQYLRAIDPASAGRTGPGGIADERNPYLLLGEDLATPANILVAVARNKDMSVIGTARPAWELARRLSVTALNLGGSDRDVSFSLGKLTAEYPSNGWPAPPLGNRMTFGARIDERAGQTVDAMLQRGKDLEAGEKRETPAIVIQVHRLADNVSAHIGTPVHYIGRFKPAAVRAIDDQAIYEDLGNPIHLDDNKSREARERVATEYLAHYERTPKLQRAVEKLAAEAIATGSLHLACHCQPELCHGHVLGAKVADYIRDRHHDAQIRTNFEQQQRTVDRLASPRIDLDAERLRAAVQTRFDLQGRNSVGLEGQEPQAGTIIERLGDYVAIEPRGQDPGTYQIVNIANHPLAETLRVNDEFEPIRDRADGMELTFDRETSA